MGDRHYKYVLLNEQDNVAVALGAIPKGAKVPVHYKSINLEIDIKDEIDFGHKFAIASIPQGDAIMKYGEVIGAAMRNIQPGEHVHVHNLEGKRGRGDRLVKPE